MLRLSVKSRVTSDQSNSVLFSLRPIACELVRLRQKATRSFQNGARKYYGLVRTLPLSFLSSCQSIGGSFEHVVYTYRVRSSVGLNLEEMCPLTVLIIDR